MFSIPSAAAGLGLMTLITGAQAGFNPASSNNIAVYWGQNSAGTATSQQRLSYYCQNAPDVNIIFLSFLTGMKNLGVNFASAGDQCTPIAGSGLLQCPQIEADIIECQQTYGKTIMLSLGGATYSEGGFSSSSEAVAAANNVWSLFGPVQSGSSTRPFGKAVVDGFDFDFEASNSNMGPFAAQLRSLTSGAGGKPYYLSAAPQCPYPDQADKDFLTGQVAMDFVSIQFYNNYCGVSSPSNFNFDTWDNWAKTVSANKNVKVLTGIPSNTRAANSGSYISGSALAQAISTSKGYSSFGGVMMWDMSQLFTNPGFLDQVVSDLGGSATPPQNPSPSSSPTPTPTKTTTSSTKTPTPTPTSSSSPPTPTGGSGGLDQWAQCGGNGYTGPTQCASPYTCVATSVWWSQCE